VSFRLEVEESVFVSEWSDKLDVASRLSTAFAMLLTAMSVMRVAKTFLGRGIDSLLIRRAERTASEVPADVERRIIILEEKFITEAPAKGDGAGSATGSSRTRRLSEIGRRLLSKKKPAASGNDAKLAAAEEAGVEMTSLAVHKNPMKKRRSIRSGGGSSAAVKSGGDGVAVVANPLSAEPPTRREFELQQQRIEEQERRIEEQQRCNEEQERRNEEQQRCNEEQEQRIEEQERRNEEQQRQIDNLIKMVTSLQGGSLAISAGALLEPTESSGATNTTITGSGGNTTNDSSGAVTGADLGEEWSRHLDKTGRAYYHNKLTGDVQWDNPMTGNEDSVANEQSSLNATTTKPMATRRNSRRLSSFAKNRRRSSVQAALNSTAENQPGKSTTH
jgi:hypothetical protein